MAIVPDRPGKVAKLEMRDSQVRRRARKDRRIYLGKRLSQLKSSQKRGLRIFVATQP